MMALWSSLRRPGRAARMWREWRLKSGKVVQAKRE
jgi:hypothetical protein